MAASYIVRFTEHPPTNQVGPIGTVAHLVRRVVTNPRYQQSPVQSTASSEKNIRGKQGKNETKKIIEKKKEKNRKNRCKATPSERMKKITSKLSKVSQFLPRGLPAFLLLLV